jgi:hypothetical protein
VVRRPRHCSTSSASPRTAQVALDDETVAVLSRIFGHRTPLLWDVAHHGEAAIAVVTRVIRGLRPVEGRQ